MNRSRLNKLSDTLWEIPPTGGMRVPAHLYATERMIDTILADNAPEQAANVAHLPGIVRASLAMPDIHWGYGFPIGGVAAFDAHDGVISPGGVGYDINCGVRLMASPLTRQDLGPHLRRLVEELFRRVPSGVGSAGPLKLTPKQMRQVAVEGAGWALRQGHGTPGDLAYMEEHGCIGGADPQRVSERAYERGAGQLGTLGSGNHFLEIGYVSEIDDAAAARTLGLALDQLTVIIHTGSRGFGHQTCEDYLGLMDRAVGKYRIALPDRQLACAPIHSEEGQAYLGAMRCAINYAFANRQVIAHRVREAFAAVLGPGAGSAALRTVYEVAHNIAKFETHDVNGESRKVCVHRKGATRAYAPGRPEVPAAYQAIGQPVLIPGDMGRYSYVLTGTPRAMAETFGSTCHGAGRAMSRHQALKAGRGRDLLRELAGRGIVVQAQDRRTLAEEMPDAYKDVAVVVDTCARAGLSNKVAQLKPLGCVKG
ncbi:MAG: RtcB family protein [Lentisphaerae bacterium]|nr:RtcB family protein [Lentisphaerota bacterium]